MEHEEPVEPDDGAPDDGVPDDGVPDDGVPDGYEEHLAELRRSAIEAGRRKGGVAGAAVAGAMLALAEIYEGPRKDDAPVTVEASGDPDDVDRDGIGMRVGAVDVAAPPLDRLDPVVGDQRKRPQV